MSILATLFAGNIKDVAEGAGTLAKDIRAAITGKEVITQADLLEFERIANKAEEISQNLPIAVNQTMQAEGRSEHWMQWAWRPLWGIISAFAFLLVVILCGVLAIIGIVAGKAEALVMIPQLVMAFTGLFSIPGAILGVTAWHRGKEKREVKLADIVQLRELLVEVKLGGAKLVEDIKEEVE